MTTTVERAVRLEADLNLKATQLFIRLGNIHE